MILQNTGNHLQGYTASQQQELQLCHEFQSAVSWHKENPPAALERKRI
jgi:hypothetical protein